MKMTGWKSKVGAALLGTALMITSAIPMLPDMVSWSAAAAQWMKFAAALLTGAGTFIFGVGIAHKIEKSGEAKTPPAP